MSTAEASDRPDGPAAPPRRLSLGERAGGWIIAACLHLALLAVLGIARSAAILPPDPTEPVRIVFAAPDPVPEPEPAIDEAALEAVESPPVETPPEPAVETPPEPAVESPPEPTEPTEPAELAAAPAPVPEAEPQPQPPGGRPAEELVELARELHAESEALEQANQLARQRGSQTVAAALAAERAAHVARQTIHRARPLQDGVVRSVDTSDVSDAVADEVLRHWGFNVMIQRLEPGQAVGSRYLSSVETSAGKFVGASVSGVYRILTFGDGTIRRLMQLEEAELARRGIDLSTVRVKRVIFGIVPAGSQYDLGIIRLDTEPIAPAPPPPAQALVEPVR